MNGKVTFKAGGIFIPLLAIVFITLKLTGTGIVANQGWLWVLSPLWFPITIAVSISILILLGMFIYHMTKK